MAFCVADAVLRNANHPYEAFRGWEACVPAAYRDDQIWRFHAYRVALYLLDVAIQDVRESRADKALPYHADQLLRAVASVSANVAEGFGRTSSTDRARFFGIALGSLRESFVWYRALRGPLADEVLDLRAEQLTELRRLLIGALKWLAAKPPRSSLI